MLLGDVAPLRAIVVVELGVDVAHGGVASLLFGGVRDEAREARQHKERASDLYINT